MKILIQYLLLVLLVSLCLEWMGITKTGALGQAPRVLHRAIIIPQPATGLLMLHLGKVLRSTEICRRKRLHNLKPLSHLQ